MNCASYCGWSARQGWKPWPGPPGTATGRRTATISTASAACARLTGASASCPSGWKAPKWSTQTSNETGTRYFFGATVTYANGRGTEMAITIVGIDEADLDRGQVSWLCRSPER